MAHANDRAPLDRRIPLAHLPTPLIPLERLGAHLGLRPGQLLAKLDDVTGLAGGGNKVRKLEYLCAEARVRGCDTLVTGGGAQSNHARLTAAAARRLGFDCTLVLGGPPPEPAVGNVVLDRLFDADIVWLDTYTYEAVEADIAAACDRLRAAGRRPYHIPIGGSTPLGALGYVRCAHELRAAAPDLELVVIASGSGGTHAGLAAGLGDHRCVYGVDVGARPGLAAAVQVLAADTARLADLPEPIETTVIDSTQVGAGYAAQTAACREAIRLAARLEGLVLDPVYTGKALAGLIAARRRGALAPSGCIVFVHTGGLPAIFTPGHAAWLTQR
jgi:L-cysteate sulfo-lyase